MSRFIYADVYSYGTFHEMYNASSLKMFACIFDEVMYYASPSSHKVVLSILQEMPENVSYKSVWTSNPKSRIGGILRYLIPVFTSIFILFRMKKNDVVFFNYNALWAMWVINFIATYLKRRVIITCHGEMEYLVNDTKLNFFSNKALHLFQSNTFKVAPTLYFCCLGENIKKNLRKIVGAPFKYKFISFEHTCIFSKSVDKEENQDGIIRIGTVGGIRKEKGLFELMNFGKDLQTLGNMELYAIGRVFCDPKDLTESGIHFIEGADKRLLDRSEIDSALAQMDYLVFLYPKQSYNFIASGALFDAINSEKYILSLRNSYFDDFFENRAVVGKLFEDRSEIIDFLLKYGNKVPYVDYEKIKYDLSPEKEASNILKVLCDIGWYK